MSGVIPLPPECFHLGKLVLEESSVLQLSSKGLVFLLFPLDHVSFLCLALFFRTAGHSIRSMLSSPSKKTKIQIFLQRRNVARIRGGQDIVVQTLSTGPVWT